MKGVNDISRYITDLLYRHDCVIVPGLGGFILQYEPARHLATMNTFLPPAREVTFNSLLQKDDGLLVNYVSSADHISYSEAKAFVASYVNGLLESIEEGREVSLPGIGTLRHTSEKSLLFRPLPGANFHEHSFGLAPVIAQPVYPVPAKPLHARKPAPRTDRKPRPATTKAPASVKWAIGVSVPVILFLLWGILFPASFQDTYSSYSSFVPRSPGSSSAMEKTPATDPQPSATVSFPQVTVQEIAQPEEVSVSELKYHVIGGVFRSMTNAERYIECLKSMGYDARLVGTNPQGHHRVSFGSFGTMGEAEKFLLHIQARENPSAWILNY